MPTDLAGQIMAYEAGEMTRAEVRVFFQTLIDMEIVCKMEGSYGRMARILIGRGECHSSHQAAPLELHQGETRMNRDHTGRLNWSTSKKCILAGLAILCLQAVLGVQIFPFSSLIGVALFIYGLVLHQRGLRADSARTEVP